MLLERDDLLTELEQHRVDAADGSGSLVLIAGEAGAGKSTLVHEFLDRLDHATVSAVGACDPLTTPRPLGALLDFGADLGVGSGHADRFVLFESILDRLRSTVRPVVIVIEDVHWADEGTLDFLRFVGRRVGDTNGLVLCTYRDDEIGTEHPLRPVLGQIVPLTSTHRIDVPSLTSSAVAELAAGTGIDPDALYERTGGNAFFVTEVLASDAPVPVTVADAVLARTSRLDGDARRLVEAVAISPRDLEVDRACVLADCDLASVDAAVEDSLPPARQLGLHRRMIELLEDDQDRDVARLAHHADRAGDADLIVRYAPDAATEAADSGSRREAIAFYRAALAHPERLSDDTEARLSVELGTHLQRIEQYDASVEALERAIELYRAAGDIRSVARTLIVLQSSAWAIAGREVGMAKTTEALRLLEADEPSEELALVHYRVAHNHMIDRQRDASTAAALEARRVAEAVGSELAAWRADMILGCVEVVMGDPSEGASMLTRSLEEARRLDDATMIGVATSMLGSGGGEARRYAVAIPALERGVAHDVATDNDSGAAYNLAWLARVAFEQGRWDDAAAHADAARRTTSEQFGIGDVTARCALGRLRVRRGDPGGVPLLDEVIDVADGHLFQYVWNAYCGRAEHAWLEGRLDAGSDSLRHAFDRAMASDSPWARGEVGFWMWRAGAIDGPPEEAAEPFALQMAGDWEAAAQRWADIGCPYEQAMALADGHDEAVRAALTILDDLGAEPAARMLRLRLRDRGVVGVPRGPSRATRSNPAGLTNRQLEVLELMAEGLSNGEIAERLYVSKKTVEHHVSAVLTKLEADTRTRAVAVALDRGVVQISG